MFKTEKIDKYGLNAKLGALPWQEFIEKHAKDFSFTVENPDCKFSNKVTAKCKHCDFVNDSRFTTRQGDNLLLENFLRGDYKKKHSHDCSADVKYIYRHMSPLCGNCGSQKYTIKEIPEIDGELLECTSCGHATKEIYDNLSNKYQLTSACYEYNKKTLRWNIQHNSTPEQKAIYEAAIEKQALANAMIEETKEVLSNLEKEFEKCT